MTRFNAIFILSLVVLASCQEPLTPTTTQSSTSSDAQTTQSSPSSDAQTTQSSTSSDAQTTQSSTSSDAQTTQSSSSSNAPTTQSSSSSNTPTTISTTTQAPSTTTVAPAPKNSTEICQMKYPNSVVQAIQMGHTCQARCALVKRSHFFFFEFIDYLDNKRVDMLDGEKCDHDKQCLNSNCVKNDDVNACKAKTSKPLASVTNTKCKLECKTKDGVKDVTLKSGRCEFFGKCREGECRHFPFYK